MLKRSFGMILFSGVLLLARAVYSAEGAESLTRSQILREHHNLMHQILMVLRDNVDMTEKLLDGKVSSAQRRTMKKKLTDLNTEIGGMIEKHDDLMKSFEQMIQKRELLPEKEAEGLTP